MKSSTGFPRMGKHRSFLQVILIVSVTAIFIHAYSQQPLSQLEETERQNQLALLEKESIINALKKKKESDFAALVESLKSDIGSIGAARKDSPRVPPAYLTDGSDIFLATANLHEPVTDKVTTHEYNIMYGKLLLPYYYKHPKMKMLEIGLGCDMNYAPGASVGIWLDLFPEAELWEAEYDGACVKKSKEKGQLDGVNTLVGDQGDPKVLDEWIEKSGGNFDVVIDDGGHKNCQIWTSFEKLWPTVKRGGLYFIEDLHVSNTKKYKDSTRHCDGSKTVPERLKEVLDRLMYEDSKGKRATLGEERTGDVEFLLCQTQACVLQKKV